MVKFLVLLIAFTLLMPVSVIASDQAELLKKIETLSKELEKLKMQMLDMQRKDEAKEQRINLVEKKAESAGADNISSWLEIGGDYRFRFDYLKGDIPANWLGYGGATTFSMQQLQQLGMKYPNLMQMLMPLMPQYPGGFGAYITPVTTAQSPKNESIMLNRFGLNLKAKATEDVQVKARLLMYKVWGHDDVAPVGGPFGNAYFADRFVTMDGNLGHIPDGARLRVDTAYATWSNILGAPAWFSVGRRPSTGGIPTNIRQNKEKTGTAGVPGLLVDYAFDGLTIGYAPDISSLPGAYAKFCYGKGFDSGYRTDGNTMKDVNFVGLNLVPYETDNLRLELQYQRGFDIFAFPGYGDPFGLENKNKNIGHIDWWGTVISGTIPKLGPGNLNLFFTGALSVTHPNDNTYNAPFIYGVKANGSIETIYAGRYGLLYNDPAFGGEKKSRTGTAFYTGARYDILSTGTKIGLEYNYGSKYWIGFTPAGDDLWTSKLATRGNVFEVYLIQQLNKKPIAKRGDAFVRLGYQYYDFKYTNSGFWLGEPQKISDLNLNDPATVQMFAPVKKAHDLYITFDVVF
ncbi:MAG TPA: DUF3373 domain-containing protein [Nitrospirae bacterium]|nr:DUF3373 domain-containing protein [Nitrospirota bacterium]